jgi:hypothetical protein
LVPFALYTGLTVAVLCLFLGPPTCASRPASPSYTLKVMTVVAVVIFPVVPLYRGWSLWTFRKRLVTPTHAGSAGPRDVGASGCSAVDGPG